MPCSCCLPSTDGIDRCFSRESKKYAKRYDRKGFEKVQTLLLTGLRQQRIEGTELLEIGFGVGTLHQQLLRDGAARAYGIEAAEGMLSIATERATEQGVGDRVTYRHGDFVRLAPEVPPVDVTLSDKVMCCYPDIEGFLRESLTRTRRVYAFVYPRNRWLMRAGFAAFIGVSRLLGWKFRPYWHSHALIEQRVAEAGFRKSYDAQSFAWWATVWVRTDAAQPV